MNNRFFKALYIILISLGLAFVFNFLFFEKEIGISVFIFSIALLGAVFLFGLYQKLSFKKIWWLILFILFFSLMPGIRANEFLNFLNVCATLGLLMLLVHELAGTPTFLMKLADYIILILLVPFRMLGKALSTISFIGQIHSKVKNRDLWLRVVKGIVMALPILIIFSVLFSQADLAFSKFINNFITLTISEDTIQYLVLLSLAFVASLSFISYIFFPETRETVSHEKPNTEVNSGLPAQAGQGIEVLVFLGLISVLFLVFVGFQITYLFGGETNIVDAGFTYSEYARRGFWELLTVGILSLLILLASEKYAGNRAQAEQQPSESTSGAGAAWPSSYDDTGSKNKVFIIPALILIAEVIIVIISAFKRLSLYIDVYSLTELRFYVAGFIILLSVLFILLAIKFIKTKPENFFTFGTLLSIISFLVIVNVINPDAFIARSNLEQYHRTATLEHSERSGRRMTSKIDASYLGSLSHDAVIEKIELYNKLTGENKEILRELFQKQKESLQKSDINWQSTNFSRTQALKLLNQLGE